MSGYRKALEEMLREWDRKDAAQAARPPQGNGRG